MRRRAPRREETVHDPKHNTSSVKHGGGSFMVWSCTAASETGYLVFIDDAVADNNSRMSSEVHWARVSAQIQPNDSKLPADRQGPEVYCKSTIY